MADGSEEAFSAAVTGLQFYVVGEMPFFIRFLSKFRLMLIKTAAVLSNPR